MIDKPMFFDEALGFVLKKNPSPSEWDSATWSAEKPAVRVRAFLSSRVENVRFLDRAQGLLFDYMAGVRDDVVTPSGERTTAVRIGGRADFVRLMREFMIREGMAKADEFGKVNQNDLTDIRSEERLRLIFDTTTRQAFSYGKWRQGMTPAVRRAFPASRFIRVRGVQLPRPRHLAHLGDVRLKSDIPYWARYQNDPLIGGFGVPWGPYGFRSGMDQEDVPRSEARQMGLLKNEKEPENLPGLNSGWQASVRGMDPALKAKLLASLRGGPKPRDPQELGREVARKARLAAIGRRIDDAEARGDRAEVARLKAKVVSPPGGLPIEVDGERILLVDDIDERLSKIRKRELSPAEMAQAEAEKIHAKVDRRAAESQRGEGRKSPPVRKALLVERLTLTLEERAILESPHEILLAYSADGRLKKTNLGNRTSVPVPNGLPDDAILSHNHPGGRGPSGPDLRYILNNPGQTLRVVAKNENGRTEVFQIKVTRKTTQKEITSLIQNYQAACDLGGDTPPARREAVALLQERFGDILTITTSIL